MNLQVAHEKAVKIATGRKSYPFGDFHAAYFYAMQGLVDQDQREQEKIQAAMKGCAELQCYSIPQPCYQVGPTLDISPEGAD